MPLQPLAGMQSFWLLEHWGLNCGSRTKLRSNLSSQRGLQVSFLMRWPRCFCPKWQASFSSSRTDMMERWQKEERKMSFFGIDCAQNKERGELQSDGRFVQLLWMKLSVLDSTNLVRALIFMKFNTTVLFKSESERKLRANDREYNCSFKYAVSTCVVVACLPLFHSYIHNTLMRNGSS